jgi:hypothetical protein
MTSQTENYVTGRVPGHGFLFVSNKCFVSVVNPSELQSVSSVVRNGGLLIAATKGHIKPEATSPLDTPNTVSALCVLNKGRIAISVARGRA